MNGIRRLHAGRERLVAGRAGERVEPDEPVAVAPQAGRLGGDERRVAAVPAVRDDDDDAARAQRPPRPLWLNSRNDSPIRVPPAQSVTLSATRASARSRSRSCISRVTRVRRVPNTNDSVGPRAAGQRLDEPQQQPRVALHRARDVAQDHELARLADLAPPHPLHELAPSRGSAGTSPAARAGGRAGGARTGGSAGARAAAAGGPRTAPRRAARPRSSGRSRGGAGPRPWTTRRARWWSRRPRARPPRRSRGLDAHRRELGHRRRRARPRPPRRRRLGSPSSRSASGDDALDARRGGRRPRLRQNCSNTRSYTSRSSRRRTNSAAPVSRTTALRPMSTQAAERPGEVDRRAEVHGQARRAQRPPEADGLGQQAAAVDGLARGREQERAGVGIAHRAASRCPAPTPGPSPRRGTSRRPGRAPGGCPPRT